MKNTSMSKTLELRSGIRIPQLGFGVYQAGHGAETIKAVTEALQVGYRHIDTAHIYGNEHEVGVAVKTSGIPREEIFITTKLWNSDQGYDSALKAFDTSLARLGTGYIDLYLVHWPVAGLRLESWRALEYLLKQGKVKAIGVSNFMVHHLEELASHASEIPTVNQIEVTPFLQQRDVRAWCEKHGIIVEAYSPLTRGKRINHPVVSAIAQKIGRTPAQVLLRWGLQHNLVVLPKSTHAERIKENANIFDFALDENMMEQLDNLEEGLVTGWDPREARWR